MPRTEFEPATPATKRPQTYVLHRVDTGIVKANIVFLRHSGIQCISGLIRS
jgi:hypothetical protein